MATAEFEQHLELFRRCQATEGQAVPRITFDDGHISNAEYAMPMLERTGLRAHFFITAGWISNRPEYMTWAQVRQLHASGHTIGAHGMTHKLLTHCSSAELDTELVAAKSLLEDKLGAPVTTLSLPGGRYNRTVLDASKRAGYLTVFTSEPRMEDHADSLLTGRLNIRSGTDTAWLESLLHPNSSTLRRLTFTSKLKAGAQRAMGDRLYAKAWALLNHADAQAD